MHNIDLNCFVTVRVAPILEILERSPGDLTANKVVMQVARADQTVSFHAVLLPACGVDCIGYTHPIAINRLMCRTCAHDFAERCVLPDEVILCGPKSVFVSYVDPGLPLVVAICDQTRA